MKVFARWWVGAGFFASAAALAGAGCAKLLGTDDCSVTGCPAIATCTLVRGAAECVANPVVPPMVDAGTGTGSGIGVPDGGEAGFGYGNPPVFPPGDGGLCVTAAGASPDPTCDPSDERGCSMLAGSGCAIDPRCTAGNPACEAFTTNSGPVQNFRLRLLNITAPKVLTLGFIQATVITGAVDIPASLGACGENGSGLFNWLISVDTVHKTVETGGAPYSADPLGVGYCYFDAKAAGQAIAPVTTAAIFTGNTFSTPPLKETLFIPIFQGPDPTDYSEVVILPVSGAYFHDVTVSNEGNCIGSVNNGALQAGSCTDPAATGAKSCSRWHTGGGFAGYITGAQADEVEVTSLTESLCSLLSGTSEPGTPFSRCTPAGLKAGDYCSTGGSCTDSFWLAATFAASAVHIDDSGKVPVCARSDGG